MRRSMTMHQRIARSHRFRRLTARRGSNRPPDGTAFVFFDHLAGKDTDDCRARIVRIATAEINASGIVGAYFESRQTCPEYSRHSVFPIFKMADYDRNAALRHASPLMVYANILRLTIPLVGRGIIVSRSNRI
ncbi:hypothetical protein [Burkholderia seminalis]|uniref:hypothetical protein n=1 Tax=Burkholderia seminalis TaxID=488731 RepID=UPI00264B9FE6|nr:hypothetical protein [Burkholderia seminalis]MDN7852236.1 hypothetical protein [Burkholderia seminalis]